MRNEFLLRLRTSLTTALLCVVLFASAQTVTIKIDVGKAEIQSPSPWNNLTAKEAGTKVENLVTTDNAATDYSISVTSAFDGHNSSGLSADPSLGLVDEASTDSFYGQNGSTGAVLFSNLDQSKSYSFSFFGSRAASDNREVLYEVKGENNGSATLNASDNTSSLAQVDNITPRSNGTISVSVSAGDNNDNGKKYYYLGAIILTEGTTTAVSSLEDIPFSINIYPNPASTFINVNLQAKSYGIASMEIYNLTGKKISSLQQEVAKGDNLIRLSTSNLSKGVYLLKIMEGGKVSSSKFTVSKD